MIWNDWKWLEMIWLLLREELIRLNIVKLGTLYLLWVTVIIESRTWCLFCLIGFRYVLLYIFFLRLHFYIVVSCCYFVICLLFVCYSDAMLWFWCDFGVILVWFWCKFGVNLVWFWCDFGVILVWFWCDFGHWFWPLILAIDFGYWFWLLIWLLICYWFAIDLCIFGVVSLLRCRGVWCIYCEGVIYCGDPKWSLRTGSRLPVWCVFLNVCVCVCVCVSIAANNARKLVH